MEKEGFKFFFPGAPSEWDPEYLHSVLAHFSSLQALKAKQRWEAKNTKNELPPTEGENVQQTALTLTEGLVGLYKGKPGIK